MVENVLIVDTETTALEPELGQVIEVGAILYSVKYQTIIQQVATLLPAQNNPAQSINRIDVAPLLEIDEKTANIGLQMIVEMAKKSEFAMVHGHPPSAIAHNAEFDKKWFGIPRTGEIELPVLVDGGGKPLRWLCTCDDFEFPNQIRQRMSLVDLALAHGIGVYANHRALTDCQLIAWLFDVMEDLQGMFVRAARVKGRYIALVSFEDRGLAKEAGFRWFPKTKTWERVMAKEDVEGLGFGVKLIDEGFGNSVGV
ncbi:MAG: 3'-5' exonuclease [Mastigocoleus sp.]